jgi:GTPase SAR1 family protein
MRATLAFVGQGRAGKTSSIRSLTGRSFNADEESTRGMASEEVAFDVTKTEVQAWSTNTTGFTATQRIGLAHARRAAEGATGGLAPGADFENFDPAAGKDAVSTRERERELVEEAMMDEGGDIQPDTSKKTLKLLKKKSMSRAGEGEDGASGAAQTQGQDHNASGGAAQGRDMSGDPMAATEEQEEDGDFGMQRLDQAFFEAHGKDADDAQRLVLDVWDFGGQKVFYSLHHIFLSR